MNALGEAALELPWLAPCVASLTTLAGAELAEVWPQLRSDPGMVLLLARAESSGSEPLARARPALARGSRLNIDVLHDASQRLETGARGFVDWNQPGPDLVYHASLRQAQLGAALASRVGADPDRAWMAGMLAPLGWLAACAVDPARVRAQLEAPGSILCWQQDAWGLDHTPLARRLARHWHLPDWLVASIGHLGLHVEIAGRLGADPVLFQIVQLAVLLYQQHRPALALAVGSSLSDLLEALHLEAADVEETAWQVFGSEIPNRAWEAPAQQPLLPSLLRLAVTNRRLSDDGQVEALQRDLDRLHDVLQCQSADQAAHLEVLKLAALAELAAGAGHEINNPLAVISGQAQYIQRQMQLLDGPAEEIEDIGTYLENLRATVFPSLQKIIGQTQRIHGILTGLMQFARPSTPRPQPIEIGALVRQAAEPLVELARERQVRLVVPEVDPGPVLEVDPGQLRTALTCLLRNAVEHAPTGGWAGVRIENPGKKVELIVEDSGPGPSAVVREHLFDPFFSGRSAGRGRGLGLPTAWRLVRQHGGDVHFDAQAQGLTRFVLTLPAPALCANGSHNGCVGKSVSAA